MPLLQSVPLAYQRSANKQGSSSAQRPRSARRASSKLRCTRVRLLRIARSKCTNARLQSLPSSRVAAALVVAERAASGGHYSEADFTVLTKTNWPTPRFNACTLPRAIAASADTAEEVSPCLCFECIIYLLPLLHTDLRITPREQTW